MKRLFLFAMLTCAFASVKAQQWTNYYRSREVEINYQSVECHDLANGIHKKIVILQFANRTNKKLSVSYNKQMWYNGNCIGCDNAPEQHFTVMLNPQQVLTGSCGDKHNKSLYLVEKMLNSNSVLAKFELSNIQITAIR